MNELTLKEALDVIENEATCLDDYDEYSKVMELIGEIKSVFKI